MALENLFKIRNLRRTLLALAAGAAAVFVYLTAEHFAIIPATGALDESGPEPFKPGDRSVAIIPVAGESPAGLARPVALELIRQLVGVPGIEVIGPRSALAVAPPGGPLRRSELPDVAWRLEVRALPGENEPRLAATLYARGIREPAWRHVQGRADPELSGYISELVKGLAGHIGFAPRASGANGRAPGPDLFRNFLLGRFLNLGGTKDLAVAGDLLEGVVLAVPDWAPGHAALAHNLLLRAVAGDTGAEALVDAAATEIEAAVELEPDMPEPYLYRSLAAHRFGWDWQGAYEAALAALERAPAHAEALAAAATAAFTLGRFDEAVGRLRMAIALDPLVPAHRVRFALALEFSGRGQEAIDAFRDLMVFDPDFPGAHARLARTLLVAGRPESARLHAEVEASPFWHAYSMALALAGLDRNDEAAEQLERIIEKHGNEAAVQVAEIHAFSGQADPAFEWLARAVEQHDPGVAELIGNPMFESVHADPRWEELIRSLGLEAAAAATPEQ